MYIAICILYIPYVKLNGLWNNLWPGVPTVPSYCVVVIGGQSGSEQEMQHQTSGVWQWLAVFEVAMNDIHDDLAVFLSVFGLIDLYPGSSTQQIDADCGMAWMVVSAGSLLVNCSLWLTSQPCDFKHWQFWHAEPCTDFYFFFPIFNVYCLCWFFNMFDV